MTTHLPENTHSGAFQDGDFNNLFDYLAVCQ